MGGRRVRLTMYDMMFRQLFRVARMHDRKGYSLLLSVIITSAVLSTATALAGIILSEVRQTREVGDAIGAQLEAEGIIEEGLFVLRKGSYAMLRSENSPWAGEGREVSDAAPLRPFRIEENDFISLPIESSSSSVRMQATRWVPSATCSNSGGESW